MSAVTSRTSVHPDFRPAAQLLAGLAPSATPDEVRSALYLWYLNCSPLPRRAGPVSPVDLDLGAACSAAHADRGRFSGGWRVRAVHGPVVVAAKGELDRVLRPGSYTVPARPGLAPRVGDALLADSAWTWTDEETGFWYTRRGVWPPPASDHLVRTYVNVGPFDAPEAVRVLTAMLARHPGVSYQLKTPIALDHGGRADAVVLYLGAPDAAALTDDLMDAGDQLDPVLRPLGPRLTHPLRPGLAQAHGRLGGESFGELRCALLAQAWLDLAPADRSDPVLVRAALIAALLLVDLDPARPDLEAEWL